MKKIFCLSTITLVLCCSFLFARSQQADDGTIQPLVQVRSEDYCKARKHFKTNLVKQTHAPSRIDSIAVIPGGVTQIEFPSKDAATNQMLYLKAWTNMPPGNKNKQYPTVIFLHGGFAFEKEDWDMAKPFRDSGFIVVAPILRGEDGQKGVFSMFYNETDDIISLITYLRTIPVIDKKRIFLAGHSVGGTVALLTSMSTRYLKKAASFSASPDQQIYCRYGINPKHIPFDTTNIKEFEVRSPLSYAGSFKCPARLYYGTREPHFHLSTIKTISVARMKGLDVQSIQVEGGHEDAVPKEIELAIKFFLKD